MSDPPLLDLFCELRRRNLLLGVSEYLACLEALAAGFGGASRAELCWMCQALWSKSPEQHDQIAEALEAILPRKITEADLEKLAREARNTLNDREGEHREDALPERDTTEDNDQATNQQEMSETGRMELAQVASTSADTPLLSRATEAIRRRSRAHFDLVGELQVPRRYIKRAWRYLRRMQRVGPAVELDVEATAARRYHEGVLVAPVLVPLRRNLTSVLILVDEGGSMIPFRPATTALIDSARQSGFARMEIFYFHDQIEEAVYRDPSFRTPIALADALRPYSGGGVLILSDAGAARRQLDRPRAEKTQRILASMLRQTPRIVWLNPVPIERWQATTAEAICRTGNVTMYSFDRNGLDAAMNVLRGRTN